MPFRVFFSLLKGKLLLRKTSNRNLKKTGIFPYNPSLILDKITKKLKTEISTTPKTLISYRIIRRIYRIYKFKPILKILSQILRVNERLTTKLIIDQYMIKKLINFF